MSRRDGTATARWLGRYAHDSPEWREARGFRIGGSEVAAIVGLSPWDSRYSLWMRKNGHIGPKPSNSEMHWGTVLEPVIREEWLRRHPEARLVRGTARGAGTWVRRDDERFLANPDALVIRGRRREVLEIKTVQATEAWKWGRRGTDEIPPYYLTQTRWYLYVLGLDVAHVAALVGGSDLREYVIRPDEDDTEWMIAEVTEFLESLESGTPPPLDGSDATYEAVREVIPDVDRDAVAVLATELANGYHGARAALTFHEREAKRYASEVLAAMGTAYRAETEDGRTIATRTRKRRGDGWGLPYLTAARDYRLTGHTTTTTEENQ